MKYIIIILLLSSCILHTSPISINGEKEIIKQQHNEEQKEEKTIVKSSKIKKRATGGVSFRLIWETK